MVWGFACGFGIILALCLFLSTFSTFLTVFFPGSITIRIYILCAQPLKAVKSALTSPPSPHPPPPVVYSTDCSKAVVPVLVLLYVALWIILRGDLF